MTLASALAFAAAFFLLAVTPGPGFAAIMSRALGSGFAAGMAVTTGLIVGDAIFMGVAIIGLSAIASAMGPLFQIVKYCGAAYLVWLGIQTLRAEARSADAVAQSGGALWQDMGLGLLVTLGNPKPIVFYGAFLPTFLDLTVIGVMDFVILMSIVMAVSYVVYAGYILLAQRTRRLFASTRTIKRLNQATGAMLVGTGIAVAAR